jgi:hypothetical protein
LANDHREPGLFVNGDDRLRHLGSRFHNGYFYAKSGKYEEKAFDQKELGLPRARE